MFPLLAPGLFLNQKNLKNALQQRLENLIDSKNKPLTEEGIKAISAPEQKPDNTNTKGIETAETTEFKHEATTELDLTASTREINNNEVQNQDSITEETYVSTPEAASQFDNDSIEIKKQTISSSKMPGGMDMIETPNGTVFIDNEEKIILEELPSNDCPELDIDPQEPKPLSNSAPEIDQHKQKHLEYFSSRIEALQKQTKFSPITQEDILNVSWHNIEIPKDIVLDFSGQIPEIVKLIVKIQNAKSFNRQSIIIKSSLDVLNSKLEKKLTSAYNSVDSAVQISKGLTQEDATALNTHIRKCKAKLDELMTTAEKLQ